MWAAASSWSCFKPPIGCVPRTESRLLRWAVCVTRLLVFLVSQTFPRDHAPSCWNTSVGTSLVTWGHGEPFLWAPGRRGVLPAPLWRPSSAWLPCIPGALHFVQDVCRGVPSPHTPCTLECAMVSESEGGNFSVAISLVVALPCPFYPSSVTCWKPVGPPVLPSVSLSCALTSGQLLRSISQLTRSL